MLQRGWSKFSTAVRSQPFLATAASGTASGAIGDFLAQSVENVELRSHVPTASDRSCSGSEDGGGGSDGGGAVADVHQRQQQPFDWRRWAGQTSFGCFCSCFMMRPWYGWLDKRVGEAVTVRNVGLKVVLDDVLFNPLVEIPTFYTCALPVGLIEERCHRIISLNVLDARCLMPGTATVEGASVWERLKAEYTTTALAGWCFHIPLTVSACEEVNVS